MNNSKYWVIANYIFFSLVIVASLILTIVLHLDWWSFVTCASTILYFVFLSDKNILNAIMGFISSAAFVVVSYKLHLYGEVIYYVAFDIPGTIISFFMWLNHRQSTFRVNIRKLSIKTISIIALSTTAIIVGYAILLIHLGSVSPWLDSMAAILAMLAAILVIFRCREQWFVWILLYIVAIILWSTTFDLLMLITSISCLISSIIGYINWHHTNTQK